MKESVIEPFVEGVKESFQFFFDLVAAVVTAVVTVTRSYVHGTNRKPRW
jgi:spore maturation protein SpmB